MRRSRAQREGAIVSGLAGIPNYQRNFLRMGFAEADLAQGGAARAADPLLTWGDVEAIRRRIDEHLSAGADQVAIKEVPKAGGPTSAQDEGVLELLAP
ncbi:MAG: hypothetical protein FJX31_02950 [Alphaproteobacteria bacterium]|nr:hypothetical protein [Alphaproteobacteria bacterium]